MTDDRRLHQQRTALDCARQRVRWAKDELERHDRRAHPGDRTLDRARERLANHLRRAEIDSSWCEIALVDASAPTEVPGHHEGEDRCRQAG